MWVWQGSRSAYCSALEMANAPWKGGDQSSASRILLFGDTHSLIAEDSVLPVKPEILIIQVKCPDF